MALNKFPHVYQPIRVGDLTLKNRIQYSPIVSNHADFVTGMVTEELLEFVGAQAATGAALVTIGSTPIDFDRGRDFYGCLSVTSPNDNPGLKLLTKEVHKHDSFLSTELTHAGQWAIPRSLNGQKAWVPSVVEGVHDPDKFEEITRAGMDQVIENWIKATEKCIETGFDMVMVHTAHGNLLSSFLSTFFNQRNDEYGGSPKARWKFPLEILEAVSSVTRGKVPIEMRIVADERIPGGTSLEERIEWLKVAQNYIDMVILSTGTLFWPEPFAYNMPGYYTEPMLNVPAAAAIKEAIDIPVSVVGGISTLEQAEYIVKEGKADIVAMAKALMADPKFVVKGERGQEKDIVPCMRCLYCLRGGGEEHLDACAVNPTLGWETRYRNIIPALRKKRVMIIGGGPGGMEATRMLTKRGHEVVLYEKETKLGGHLPEASALPLKEGFRRYFEYAVRKTNESGAKIILGTEVTPELIKSEDPDVLIIACGAKDIIPPIPGIDGEDIYKVEDVDNGKQNVGQKVVVCGAGLSGSECAMGLAMEGKDVTVVDILPEDQLYKEVNFAKPLLIKHLKDNGVTTLGGHAVKEFKPGKVIVTAPGGSEVTLDADTAVLAFGLKPDTAYIDSLSDIVPETYIIGDAKKVGQIGDATTQAYYLSIEI
jgi:2,4-dienoyl-CoA reductase-like NADH-dependent reductase (Old Yellow Enzyme family)/thioredoxin reductase